jgi:3D (Asp-Asp-Asp) domain-containing protein
MTRTWKRNAAIIALVIAAIAATLAEQRQDPTADIPETKERVHTRAAVAPDVGVGRQIVEAEVEAEPELQSIGTFKLTAYCACPQCCGDWSDGITYTGTTATAGRTIAVDPTVIPLGSTVYINGDKYIAEDIGGAIKGHRIDIFHPTHIDALEFGVQYAEVLTY